MRESENPKGRMGQLISWFGRTAMDIIRGGLIGLANVIPGVSGGTMMVSMGIYDKIIYCINHLFSEFRKSMRILLPYLVGMVAAIIIGSFTLKKAFAVWPLPTNTLFVGLILGSLPMILKTMRSEKGKLGPVGVILFVIFFAIVVLQKALAGDRSVALNLSFWDIVIYFFLGVIASSTMVIPGVSGSMMLKTLGYYEPIVTETIPAAVKALTGGAWGELGHHLAVLLPFGIGIVVGIFAIAKLISMLLRRYKGWTYCAILGMVVASPVAILMEGSIYSGLDVWVILASVATFALGFFIAIRLGGEPETDPT